MLARMMDDDAGQALSTLMTDRVYRSRTGARTLTAVNHLIEGLGLPAYMTSAERLQLRMAMIARWAVPDMVARGMLREMRGQSDGLVLPADASALRVHLGRRAADGVSMNLNLLGEAVLGEEEAQRRVDAYVELLRRDGVRTVSVKISSIASQIDLLAFDRTLELLRPRLREILRAARGDDGGDSGDKLVNLDMEAYRDLGLTHALLTSVLDEEEFRDLTAGMVLQAYLPDSAGLQRTLTDWARARVDAGGAPVRLRIVKGANLAAERTRASLMGWPLPIYGSKAEVDANFKRMIDYGMRPEHVAAVRLGVATHNVFDLAYGLVRSAELGVAEHVECELLEGMAEPLRRAVQDAGRSVLLYGPVVDDAQMQSAIAYLMRRLDENTAQENFLHHSFAMRAGDARWEQQRVLFDAACAARQSVSEQPLRAQDRAAEAAAAPLAVSVDEPFANCADTDFSLAGNRSWMDAALRRWHDRPCEQLDVGPGGPADGFDPSRPNHVPYRFNLADGERIESVIDAARRGRSGWAGLEPAARSEVLGRVAAGLRSARGELIGVLVLDAGKRVQQADTEVSEAVDFAEYYRRSALQWSGLPHLRARPRGVVLVTPPWNFPLAIAAGGVLAALAAGNTVVLKPALETVWVAHELANICWDAGVPRDALQLCVCTDEVGTKLVADERIDSVVLTGASATARLFQRIRPGLHLLAETGGKNALVVSAMSDRDQAVFDVVHGAFAHAGQKCSATSLLICEREVYDDEAFVRQLRDAAASLPVGSAWDPAHVVTPLITPPSGALQRELGQLQDGQRWLLEPRVDPDNPRLLSPGIKLGVRRGHDAHTTELFGPVLSMMTAHDLYDAIEIANATDYGLTSGLHSLDEREQARWVKRIRAGNLYINRGTTGAIVRRQPFGGIHGSCFGPGAKAGGPNYVAQLMRLQQDGTPAIDAAPEASAAALIADTGRHLERKAQERLAAATCNYGKAWSEHFQLARDPSRVLGELNVASYRGCSPLVIRAGDGANVEHVMMACAAALTCGAGFALSYGGSWAARHPYVAALEHVPDVVETAAELAARMGELERVRMVGALPQALLEASMETGVHVATEDVIGVGRGELLHYVREQSLSISYHRHGNLAAAALQPYPELLPGGVVDDG